VRPSGQENKKKKNGGKIPKKEKEKAFVNCSNGHWSGYERKGNQICFFVYFFFFLLLF